MARELLILVGIAGLAYLAAEAWWNLWMKSGWLGPPPIVRSFLQGDGEAAYDIAFWDMLLASFVTLVVAVTVLRLLRLRRRGSVRGVVA